MRFLRLPDVETKVGLKKSEIYRRIKVSDFPAPVKLGGAARWSEDELDDWMRKVVVTARGQTR